jgi:hypothetical protein
MHIDIEDDTVACFESACLGSAEITGLNRAVNSSIIILRSNDAVFYSL